MKAVDEAVEQAKLAVENAIAARSSIVEQIATIAGKEGTKTWTGRDGKTRSGKIIKRMSGGKEEGDMGKVTWFFKGGKEETQDFT